MDPGKSQFQQLYGLIKADGEKDRQLSREMSDQQGNLLRELLGPLIQHVLARNGVLSNAAEGWVGLQVSSCSFLTAATVQVDTIAS